MRRAIGASRGPLVRQLVAESVVVALLVGLAGFGASFVLSSVIAQVGEVPSDVSALLAHGRRTLIAASAIAVGAVLVFGLAPALTTTRFDVLAALKDEGATSTAAHGPARLRRSFLVAQVALSLTLLVTAAHSFKACLEPCA